MEYRNLEVKDIQSHWSNNKKGHAYEMTRRYKILNIPFIEYEGNPVNYFDWLREQSRSKYDGTVTLPNGDKITLEMKYRRCKKVFHSWFMDCWLPRKADVQVTNDPNVLSYHDKRLLDFQHKKLMTETEVTVYIGRLVRNILHPSKYTNKKYKEKGIISLFFELLFRIYREWLDKFRLIISKKCYKDKGILGDGLNHNENITVKRDSSTGVPLSNLLDIRLLLGKKVKSLNLQPPIIGS